MDFALLPPEVNSARMYTGPGAGSLLAAAGGWDSLAAELATTAEAYGSVLSGLAALHWRGPAAESMAVTAAPYIGWLYTTAEKTQQTAIQARAAALAFEQAYAMTLPPPVVAANRIQLLALIATNFFGQNTAAIAATEAQYAEMWAQDAAAMYGYATASAAAALLTPFSPPRQTTNPAGLTAQAAAVSQATDPLSLLIETVTQALQALTIPSFIPEDFTFLDAIFAGYATVGVTQDVESFVAGTIGAESNLGLFERRRRESRGGDTGRLWDRRVGFRDQSRRWGVCVGCRRCGERRQHGARECRPGKLDWATIGPTELGRALDAPCLGIVARRPDHTPGDRRGRARDARCTGGASGSRASLRRPTSIRGSAHGDGPPTRGRVTRRLTDRRPVGRKRPIVRILRRVHHRKYLTDGRPLVDVDGHALIHGVLIDRGPSDDPGDGDILLAACVRSRADSGHQERAAGQISPRAARDKPRSKKYR